MALNWSPKLSCHICLNVRFLKMYNSMPIKCGTCVILTVWGQLCHGCCILCQNLHTFLPLFWRLARFSRYNHLRNSKITSADLPEFCRLYEYQFSAEGICDKWYQLFIGRLSAGRPLLLYLPGFPFDIVSIFISSNNILMITKELFFDSPNWADPNLLQYCFAGCVTCSLLSTQNYFT